MTVDGASARPWHVSTRVLDSVAARGSRPSRRPGTARTAPATAAPRWRRVVTGQAVGWRVRALLARLLRVRRATARRALGWLERRPAFRDVLADDGVVAFVRFSLSSARAARGTRPARPSRPTRYRPRIDPPDGLDVTGLHGSVAFAGVELGAPQDTEPTERVEFVAPIIEIHPDGSSDGEIRMLDAVDVSVWNPAWFRRSPIQPSVGLGDLPSGRTRRARRARARTASRARLITVDEHTPDSAADTARQLAEFAASGLPVVGEIPDDVVALLGADVASLIRSTPPSRLADDDRRERYSIDVRRAAHDAFSPRGRWERIGAACGSPVTTTPSVTVLLASNRPADVVDAARQIVRQDGVAVQLVAGLHGSHMPPELDDQLADAFGGDLVVRHLPDDLNLGQVLNELSALADGDLVTKWDDDDWYDRRHLADLVAALEYSGADMVAKAAEFVYLESLDLTIRRFATGSERFSTTVAGGTLLLTRAELAQVGWADAPRRVDRLLIDALEARSRRVYRTHGFGYVLRRRGGEPGRHTWQTGDAYFLRQSVDQRPGLDLAFAGFTDRSDTGAAS